MDEYHGDVEGSESQMFSAIPMVTSSDGGDHFPMIELGTHDHHDRYIYIYITTPDDVSITPWDLQRVIAYCSDGSHVVEPVKQEHIGAVLVNRQKLILGAAENNVTRPFYEELVEVLNFLRSGTSDFLRYLEQVNISSSFVDGS